MKIPLSFKWSYLQGDITQFLQRSVELEPMDLCLVIELDVIPEYFFHSVEINKYWEEKKVAELMGGNKPEKLDVLSPIMLTLGGVKEARRLVNEALATYPSPESQQDAEDDFSWEDEFSED